MFDENRLTAINRLASRFGYVFRDPQLLNKALTHKSYANESLSVSIRHNERFEFLGDSVIDLVVSRYLVCMDSDLSEGELSKIRAQVVNEQALAQFARKLDLGEALQLGKGEDFSGGREKNSLLSNTFEAVIAALFLDSSFDEVYEMFLAEFKDDINKIISMREVADYKGQLQKYCQSSMASNPEYRLIDETGPDHDKTFSIQVCVNGTTYSTGTGRTKKEAEQEAARKSYELMADKNREHTPS